MRASRISTIVADLKKRTLTGEKATLRKAVVSGA